MNGFKKYLIIIGSTILGLWLISIIIYWNIIGDYFFQAINDMLNSLGEIVVLIIGIMLVIWGFVKAIRR